MFVGCMCQTITAIEIFSVRYMALIRTPVEHGYQVKTACTKGPFAYFKHPTYVAMVGCSLSTVLTFNSACESVFMLLIFSLKAKPHHTSTRPSRVLDLSSAAGDIPIWNSRPPRGAVHEGLLRPRLHRVHKKVGWVHWEQTTFLKVS